MRRLIRGGISAAKIKNGEDGNAITATTTQYAASDDNQTAPTTGWADDPQGIGEGLYLWTRQKTTYSKSDPTYTDPVCDTSYISNVIRRGESSLNGGLVMGNLLGASDGTGNGADSIRAYVSGLVKTPAFAAGVKHCGTDEETRLVEINHDGSARFGGLHIDNTEDAEADTAWFGDSATGKQKVVISKVDIPALADALGQSGSASNAVSLSAATTTDVDTPSAVAEGQTMTFTKAGAVLTVTGSLGVTTAQTTPPSDPDEDTDPGATVNAVAELVYRASSSESWVAVKTLQSIYRVSSSVISESATVNSSQYVVAKAGTYAVRLRLIASLNDTAHYTATATLSGAFKSEVDLTEQATKVAKNGIQIINSKDRYFQAGDANSDCTAQADSFQVDGLARIAGMVFKPLWAAYVTSDGTVVKSTGKLVTALKRGSCTRIDSGHYRLTFPSAVGHTNYMVVANVIDSSYGGVYTATPGYRQSDSFDMQTSGRSSSSDRNFCFMVLDMSDWL